VNPSFSAKKRDWHISATYDGYTLVSYKFRDFCRQHAWQGMDFVRLPADNDFFVLRLALILPFDADRRRTRFLDKCPTCGAFYGVIGATPAYLRGVTEPIQDGFFRSDFEFGSGPGQGPLTFIGLGTAEELRKQRFQNYYLKEIQA
jgi:hypothetical protein